jgi:hypothetical protein
MARCVCKIAAPSQAVAVASNRVAMKAVVAAMLGMYGVTPAGPGRKHAGATFANVSCILFVSCFVPRKHLGAGLMCDLQCTFCTLHSIEFWRTYCVVLRHENGGDGLDTRVNVANAGPLALSQRARPD